MQRNDSGGLRSPPQVGSAVLLFGHVQGPQGIAFVGTGSRAVPGWALIYSFERVILNGSPSWAIIELS